MSSTPYEAWPELPYHAWKDTLETLHRWAQIIGKIRLARAPMVDGWWQVPLYVTARGLTTSPIPAGDRTFEFDFDFLKHRLRLTASDGAERVLPLQARSVAEFYDEVMVMLRGTGLETKIWPVPVELPEPDPARLDQDLQHASYDREAVTRWWRILAQVDQVLKEYAAGFVGRTSPVQFFWGTFDLAVARYSGRRIEPKAGVNVIERYAFGMEQVESGFWAGDERLPAPAFYAFAMPPPDGYERSPVQPDTARFDQKLGEFVLLYDDVRRAKAPRQMLLDFFNSTYDVGAKRPYWNRARLDWAPDAARPH